MSPPNACGRSDRRPIVACVEPRPACAFGDKGEVHAALAASAAEKLGAHYDAVGPRLRAHLPEAAVAGLKTRLRDATRDRVRIDDNG